MTPSGFPGNVAFQSLFSFMMKFQCNQQHAVVFSAAERAFSLVSSLEVVENTSASVCFEQIYTAEFTSVRVGFILFVCHPPGCFSDSLWVFFPPHSHFVLALISESEGSDELGDGGENVVFTCICVLIWFISSHTSASSRATRATVAVSVQVRMRSGRMRSGRKAHADVLPTELCVWRAGGILWKVKRGKDEQVQPGGSLP